MTKLWIYMAYLAIVAQWLAIVYILGGLSGFWYIPPKPPMWLMVMVVALALTFLPYQIARLFKSD